MTLQSFHMVGEVGVEPTHAGVRVPSLTTWRLPCDLDGGAKGDRTLDPRLAKPVLSQLSYRPVNSTYQLESLRARLRGSEESRNVEDLLRSELLTELVLAH